MTHSYENGRLSNLSMGGYNVSYGYNPATGRLDSLTYQPGTAEEQTFSYSYLPNSNLLKTLTTGSGLTVTKTYEPQREVLTQVKNEFGSEIISQYDYVNDVLRRRESMSTSGPAFEDVEPNPLAEITATYTTNELNQYTQISAVERDYAPAYDVDGNLMNDGTFQYVYDAENRPIAITPLDTASGLKKVEFAYDYKSRRISKKVYSYITDAWNLDTESAFVYDGWNVVKETITANGESSTNSYVRGLDLSGSLQGAGGIGGLLLRNTDSTSYLYLYDAKGNVGQLVDAADGTIAAHYEYDPFGNLLAASGPEADQNPFRFSTKYFDAETGLYYYGYRYYSPELGRWSTRDPIGEEGGLNLYGAMENDPVSSIDPLGLKVYIVLTQAFGIPGLRHCVLLIETCEGESIAFEVQEDWNIDPALSGKLTVGPTPILLALIYSAGGMNPQGLILAENALTADILMKILSPVREAGPKRTENWKPTREKFIGKFLLEPSYEHDDEYIKAASTTHFGNYTFLDNNCCHWVKKVVNNAHGEWPFIDSMDLGTVPGNPNGMYRKDSYNY